MYSAASRLGAGSNPPDSDVRMCHSRDVRCFYCGEDRAAGSPDHVVPRALGGRLKTRRACKGCNARLAAVIDDPLSRQLMVEMPRALADVRHISKQSRVPEASTTGIAPDGRPVAVRYTPTGREVRTADGEVLTDLPWVEIQYGFGSTIWTRFLARVALGCASQLFEPEWTDTRVARALRGLLWHGPIDNTIWPTGITGLAAWPDEFEPGHAIRMAIGDDRHLVGFFTDEDFPDGSIAFSYLFGGQIRSELPLPGVPMPGYGRVWVLDHRPGPPPQHEDFDHAIERMLRDRGWDDARINAARAAA
jgi:hypothetical protein